MFQKLRLNRLTVLCVLVLTVFSAVFVACKKDEENSGTGNSSVTGIAINTTAISANAGTSATCGGNITGDGGSPIIARGVCWDTLSRPTTSNNFTSDGSGIGLYSSSITGLSNGVTYYVRSYAINAKGTAYGNQVSFVAGNSVGGGGCPVVKDIDGNWYQMSEYDIVKGHVSANDVLAFMAKIAALKHPNPTFYASGTHRVLLDVSVRFLHSFP